MIMYWTTHVTEREVAQLITSLLTSYHSVQHVDCLLVWDVVISILLLFICMVASTPGASSRYLAHTWQGNSYKAILAHT
jgi:hypothetical protein